MPNKKQTEKSKTKVLRYGLLKSLKFKKNSIRYFQDFNVYYGIPADVEFIISKYDKEDDMYILKGEGCGFKHGKNLYGNGHICVFVNEIKKNQVEFL